MTPFVSEVRRNADLDKDALGFLPATVYDDAAKRGNLLVATYDDQERTVYAGHLLFGGRFPHARVFQLFVVPRFRTRDIGRMLVESLIELVEQHSYLSISARVASDLPANGFWEKVGFTIAHTTPGSSTRNRTINLRVKQLNTPDLFSFGSGDTRDLGLVDRLASHPAVYVIDLNVFWDAVRQRARSEYAAEIVAAALHQLIYIAVTSEFVKELHRTSRPTPQDPALEFALQLPNLPEPDANMSQSIVGCLGRLVFPDQTRDATLSARDYSDLLHLATAIHHSANAFVTSENAIVKAKEAIYDQFGIEILHVEEFARALKTTQKPIPAFRAHFSRDTLHIWELVANSSSVVESFLQTNAAPGEYRDDFLAVGPIASMRKRIAVTSDAEMVCLASWDSNAGLQSRGSVRLIADEEHPAVESALNCVISRVCTEASRIGPVLLRLFTPQGHAISRKVALLHGFHEAVSDQETYLQKLSIGRPVTGSNWARTRRVLQQCSGLLFPENLPTFGDAEPEIAFVTASGSERTMTLSQMEKLLSPTLIVIPNRRGAIVPIRRHYAEQLLQASRQMSLTPNREAALFAERTYFSSVRNVRILSPAVPILFYESAGSGGRACITAVARVVGTEAYSKKSVSAERLRHGVLDSDEVENLTASESVAVTTFDNVIALDRPISLHRLREIGCVDGSNLISGKQISHEQLVTVVEEGLSIG